MGPDQEAGAAGSPAPRPARSRLTRLEFRRLGPDNSDDLLSFLGGDAFSDNPRWRDCFCFYYHFEGDGAAWRRRTGEVNRSGKAALIERGRAHGVVAYSGNRVVGWVNAGPASELPALDESAPGAEGAIVCFIVDPRHRRLGIGRRLLGEACAMLRDLGLDSVDAWPLRQVRTDDVLPTSALIYHGPRSMYERAGFEVVEDAPESPFVRVRKTLR